MIDQLIISDCEITHPDTEPSTLLLRVENKDGIKVILSIKQGDFKNVVLLTENNVREMREWLEELGKLL